MITNNHGISIFETLAIPLFTPLATTQTVIEIKIPLKKIFASTMIGYFGNGILAFRLGELLKAYSVSKNHSIQVSEVFGTVILERALDLLMVLFLFFLIIPWYPFENSLLTLAIFTFIGLTFFLLILTSLFIYFNLIQKIKLIIIRKHPSLFY